MQLFEMQGLLAGKCLPGDMKVNESLAEYLLRKLEDRNELERQLSAKTISEQNIINAFGISGEGAHSKLVIEYVHGLVAENAALRRIALSYHILTVPEREAPTEPEIDAAIAEIGAKAIENAINAQSGKPFITDKTNGLAYINLGGIQDFAANLLAGRKR